MKKLFVPKHVSFFKNSWEAENISAPPALALAQSKLNFSSLNQKKTQTTVRWLLEEKLRLTPH